MKKIFLALFLSLLFCESGLCSVMQCRGDALHWREIAYLNPPMNKYKNLRNCIHWTAYQFDLPEELLYSVLYVERGDINGKCSNNTNGTQDCGPAQINDVRLSELKRFSLTKDDMKNVPCRNIWAMGYLLRREIERADNNILKGVGNYHFHYSVNSKIHDRYVRKVLKAWKNLNLRVERYCNGDNKAFQRKDN